MEYVMFRSSLFNFIYLSIFLCCSVVLADEAEVNTTNASGGNQIIVSPMNVLLDLGESGYANALVLNEDGGPVEGYELEVISQGEAKVAIEGDGFITNESGYIYFSILGKQQGDTVVTVSDGIISSHINISVRNLIHYILPYFYGDMQLSVVNPTEGVNYVKIQFYENGGRLIPPVTIRLDGKEMKTLKVSEEVDGTLKDGWIEVFSTDIIFGGVWTNKGYLSLKRIDE